MKNYYIIVTVFSSMVFLVAAAGIERYRKPRGSLLAEKFPFLRKVPRDTVVKGLAIAGIILFLKKVLYYMGPFFGIIQTPSSVWHVEPKVLKFLLFAFFLSLIDLLVSKDAAKKKENKKKIAAYVGGTVIWLYLWGIDSLTGIGIFDLFIFIFLSPMFFMKMVCSEKYLGILISFLVGYYGVDVYKKLRSKVTKKNANVLITPGLLLVFAWVIGFFYFTYFTGNWEERYQGKILSAQSEAAVEEIMDAVSSITDSPAKEDSPTKATALGQILRAYDLPWTREALRQAIKETLTIKIVKKKAEILKDLALVIARAGGREWAEEVARGIPDEEIKNSALKQLSEVQGKKP